MIHPNQLAPGTKILFANFPADGHFNPLTGLAVYLQQKGCDVRWYTSKKYQQKIEKLGLPFYPLRKAFDFAVHPDIDVVFPERKKIKSQVAKLKYDMVEIFIKPSEAYYSDLQDIHKEFPFQVLIADISFGAIPFVKEKMNIPTIGVSVFPLTETSKDLPPAGLALLPSYSFLGRIKQHLLRFVADNILFAGPTKVMTDMLGRHGIDTKGSNIFDIIIRQSTVVLQSGTPSFEYKRSDISSHIHFAGPLLPYTAHNRSLTWNHPKLQQYRKVVLVTQGTVEGDIDKLLVPTLEAFRGTDRLVIATTGGNRTEELKNRFPDENFIIEDFIPFDQVMPHADVYISNGGYGGVLLSIQHQLPMVVAGVHEGKNEINARIGYFELGINLKTENPLPAAIRKATEQVLSDGRYLSQVKKLSDEFSQYQPEKTCEELVKHVISKTKLYVGRPDSSYIY